MAEDTRERILSACERVIARSGLRGFRMQEVAREAGVSIGLLAYHFGDRDGLLEAALDHVNESAAIRAETPGEQPAPARLIALLTSEFGDDAGIRDGSVAWNELRASAVFDAGQARAVARSTADWQQRVVELVRESLGPQGADPEPIALLLTALVEGLSGRWLTGQITAAQAQDAMRDAAARVGIRAS